MKYLIFCSSMLWLCACSSRQSQEDFSDAPSGDMAAATDFLEEILKDSTEDGFIEDRYYTLADIDHLLPPPHLPDGQEETEWIATLLEEDEDYVAGQQTALRDFSTHALANKGFTIVPLDQLMQKERQADALWAAIGQRYPHGFYTVSMPVFSEDHTKAYVRLGHLCGLHCGGGETRLYAHVSGKWELAEVVEVWVN